jgi:hypothetical protein
LTYDRYNRPENREIEGNEPERELTPRSEQEKQIWEVLEQARQNVKPIVKKEIEAEIVTSELFNLRLKTPPR